MSHVVLYELHLLGERRACLRVAARDLADHPAVRRVWVLPVRWRR